MKDDNPFTAQGEFQTKRRTPSRPSAKSLDPDYDMRGAANPFEAVAEAQISGPVKAKHRAAQACSDRARERREFKQSPLELKRQEDNELAKLYRKWKREEREELVGLCGKPMAELMSLLRGLNYSSFDDLEAYVRQSRWLIDADRRVKMFALGAIDASMVRARIRDGRPPIDDPLWDVGETSPFLEIRKLLTGV